MWPIARISRWQLTRRGWVSAAGARDTAGCRTADFLSAHGEQGYGGPPPPGHGRCLAARWWGAAGAAAGRIRPRCTGTRDLGLPADDQGVSHGTVFGCLKRHRTPMWRKLRP